MPNRKPKVVVIGIDAADPDTVAKLVSKGGLPNFARLMQNGATSKVFPFIPVTAPSWSSIYTGKNPGKHGVYSPLVPKPGGYEVTVVSSKQRDAKDLWEILSDNGLRSIVINAPATYFPRPMNGILIAGHYTPADAVDFIYPPETAEEVNRAIPGYKIYPRPTYNPASRFSELLVGMRRTATLAEHFLDNHDCDFFMVVLRETDEAQHTFIDDQERLTQLYEEVDRIVGRIISKLGSETFLIVVSDHGATPIRERFDVLGKLIESGLLTLEPRSSSRKAKFLRLVARIIVALNLQPILDWPLLSRLVRAVKSRVMGLHISTVRKLTHLICWEKTSVYPYLNVGFRINLVGREPSGVVKPEEYNQACEKLISLLKDWKDQKTGQPYFRMVCRASEIMSGDHIDLAPDIIALPNDGYWPFVWKEAAETLGTRRLTWSGAHALYGLLIISGPFVRKGVRLEDCNVTDIAPTILPLYGLSVPSDMDGRPLINAFEEHAVKMLNISVGPPTGKPGETRHLTPEEEYQVEENLRRLGYLD